MIYIIYEIPCKKEAIMMNEKKDAGIEFLNKLSVPGISKEQIFNALFEARGTGEGINTNHVFFQEVIIKFNASKADPVIRNHLPYETDSHYVDVALNAYVKNGGNMHDFDKELKIYKNKYNTMHPKVHPAIIARSLGGASAAI